VLNQQLTRRHAAAAAASAVSLVAAAAPQGSLHEVSALRSTLADHKVTRHDGLERLGTGLYRHMEQAADGEGVPGGG
jgi:hypothetical protein